MSAAGDMPGAAAGTQRSETMQCAGRQMQPQGRVHENSSRFFANRDCRYFPCHEGADPDDFSCLFCYCPLYALADKCGGNFYYNDKGIKVCTNCRVPHLAENYDYVTGRLADAVHNGMIGARTQESGTE